MDTILILDGNQRSALAATRSLGREGLKVITADEDMDTLSASSRYSYGNLAYPSPYTREDEFVSYILSVIKDQKINFLLPITDITTEILLKNRSRFTDICLPIPVLEAYESVTNKFKLFQSAVESRIPVPDTRFVTDITSFFSEELPFNFPVVLKPSKSRVRIDGVYQKTSVRYAHSRNELEQIILEKPWFAKNPFMVQEYIAGQGQGVFVLCSKGNIVQYFSHKRIREKPPSGGVSVLCESMETSPRMLEIAEKILSPLQWDGVAMIEFKVTRDHTPYLIEVNGRFWGSLQLAIDSGVNFPSLLYRLFMLNEKITHSSYKIGLQERWLLGDLDSLIITLKDTRISKSDKLQSVLEFMKFFKKKQLYEINRLNDLKPFIFELKQYLKELFG